MDLRALIAEERAAAEGPSAEAYAELLKRRLASRPIVLDAELLERTIVCKPWADALRGVAGPLLVQTASCPEALVLVNTFPRVPTAAAETILVQELGLRRDTLHSANAGFDQAFDRMSAIRAFRPKTLVRGHVIASVRVRACLDLLGVRPILLVRDIFDTIASYADDRTDRPVAPGYRTASLPPAERRRIQTLRMASYLVDFYASWMAAQADGRCTVQRWEDVRQDWPGFVVDRLAEHGRTADREAVAARLSAMPAQAHSSPGHGATLSDDDRALVRSLYVQYPHLDFRPIDAGAPVA
jgi:hypothetical protein